MRARCSTWRDELRESVRAADGLAGARPSTRTVWSTGFSLLLLAHVALAESVIYPVPGHLDPAAGTIEFWFRPEVKPDPSGKEGASYYQFFEIRKRGEADIRVRLSYQSIWTTNHFHFFFSTVGVVGGQFSANPYVVTAEDTAGAVKGESAANPFPRIARLQPGDWHHVAVTWQGLPQSTVTFYLDGEMKIPSVLLPVPLWDGIDQFVLNLLSNPYRDTHVLDELRISSVARTPAEIKESIAAGRAQADRYTLLLDHLDEIREENGRWHTVPEVFTLGSDIPVGLIPRRDLVEPVADGKSGPALKFIRHYK